MKLNFKVACQTALAVAVMVGVQGGDEALVVRTQTLALQRGWNAVFLEVDPAAPEPNHVFAGLPIDMAAGFYARTASAQYVVDPAANLFRQAGWGVWYHPSRPDAFLSTLHAISGQRAYLLHATEDCAWQVTGYVVRLEVQWQPDAFNLVGFTVAAQGAPTFAEFFGGSKAHAHNRIYRLEQETWRRVNEPSAETMRSGESFWIYCDGGSSYQGPLRVDLPVQQGLVLGRTVTDVVLRNQTRHPLSATVAHVPIDADPVPMALVMQGVRGEAALLEAVVAPLPSGAWAQPLPPLEVGEGIRVPVAARREAMQQARQVSLLKISTDLGTEDWIPVICLREDLEQQ